MQQKRNPDRRSTKGMAQTPDGETRWPGVRVRPMRLDPWIDPVESRKRYPVRRWKQEETQ